MFILTHFVDPINRLTLELMMLRAKVKSDGSACSLLRSRIELMKDFLM